MLFHLVWRANEKCLSHVVWLLVSGWKRGPLAPVVVGEGQVNLVLAGVVAMGKVSKALWLIDFDDEPNRSPVQRWLLWNRSSPPVAHMGTT